MATDVIIEPGSGQIYWNDSAGSSQSISIKGDAQNTISVVGYSGAFSPGSSAGGTFVIASFNDNSGTSAFIPGTTNYDLGSTTYRWSVYGYTGNFSSDVVISSSTQSTSVTSGALRVNGGVGISGRMYFNTAAMGTTGIASPPTFAFIGSTGDPIFLQVLEDNSLSFEGSQGQLFSITPNLSTGYIYSVNDITGIPLLRANANANVTANEFGGNFGIGVTNPGFKLHVVGSVGFTSVTASTTPTSGTLVVSGGVGVGQTLNIGGRLNLWNSANTNFTSFVSTATGNTVYNLPATTPATGSSVLQSDSVGNLSWVGFVANSAAIATTAQNINSVFASTSGTHYILFSPVNGGSGVAVSSDSGFTVNPATNVITANTFSGNISATGTTSGFVGVTDNTASTNSSTGALIVTGGVGIGGSVNISGRVGIGTNLLNAALNIQVPSTTTSGIILRGNTSQSADVIKTFSAAGDTNFAVSSGGRVVTSSGMDVLQSGAVTNLFDVSVGRIHFNFPTWQYSHISWVTAGAYINQGSSQLQFTHSGTTTKSGIAVVANNWDINNRAFGIIDPAGSERTYFGNIGNLSIDFGNRNSLDFSIWNTTNHIQTNISGTAGTYSGNIFKGSVEGTERFSVGPFGNTRITVGSATTATGFIVKAVASQSGNLIETQSSAGATNFYVTPSGAVNVGSTATSISTSSGALTVSGGVGIGGSLYVASATAISGVTINAGVITGTLSGYATTARNTDVSLASTNSTHFVTFTTASSGSGLGQSADADLNYNPSTNVLTTGTFSGNVSATGVTSGLVSVTSSTASTYMANGALTVSGGVGISGQLSFNRAAMGYTGVPTNPTMAFIGTTGNPITLTVLADNGLQFEGTSGKLFGINNNLSTGWIFSVGDISGIPLLRANADGTVAMGEFAGNIGIGMSNPAFKLHVIGSVGFTSVTASTNPTSGTLVVSGGVGIGQSLNVGGRLHLWNAANTNFTAFLSAASGNHTYTLPANVPSTGTSVLQADTSGILSWVGFSANSANSASIATTAQNLNTVASTTSASHFLLFSPTNGASGVAVSSDAQLTYNPATDVLTASVFSGNVSATAVTSTNFFGTLTGNVTGNLTGTATTSQNVNTVAATTSASHFITFSPVNGASGVALSSDANLTFNPSTNVLTADIFSGNVSATAVTSTNFFGTLTGNVTGNLTGTATTSQNINIVSGNTGIFYPLFTSASTTVSGIAVSINGSNLSYNFATNVFTASVFSGNFTGTAVTATNFFGTLTGNVTGTATTSQNVNLAAGANNSNHSVVFSLNATGSGVALSSDAGLQYNPSTNVLTADVFSGNVSATAVTATNFFGTFQGSSATAVTSQNINTTSATTAGAHYLLFSPVNATTSGVAVSSDSSLQFNPATNVLTVDVFSGNHTGTAFTATNFFGTLTGNVTGNLTGTATTSQNVNTVSATTSAVHYLTFSPVNGASGVALSSDANLTFNPSTNVLTTDIFSGNVSATAVTSTNFFGTLTGNVTGNVTGTATTAQNVNLAAGANASNHSVIFSLNATGTGIALSSDAGLQYNPASNVLTADVFSGNASGTAATYTNFFGTLTGNVTGNLTGTATTSQNINTTAATTAGAHYLLFSPVNATASGVAVSSDAQLQFNPGTNVLTADVFSGNLSATAATATNFFGTLVGNSSTATTASNLNVVSATTNSAHYLTFSPASSGSGLATSADTDLAYNPSTNVLSATVFSGNFTGTAATATNFFGTLVGNSSTATTAQNINLAAGGNASNHSIVFSLNATGSGVALSSDAELQYNPSTNALSVGTGNITANAVRIGNSANTVDTSSGNLTLDSTGGQVNINDNVVIQGNLTVQGTTLTVDSTITTIVDPVIVLGSGVGGTHSTADNNQDRGIEFRYSNGGTAVTGYFGFQDTDYKFRYIPNATISGSNVYSGTVGVIVANLEGNVSATAVTATNFYGTLVGNTATATTSQNINTTTAATASAHYILFSPVNATTSGVAVSSDSTLQFNPGTNVLTTDVFSGNLSATAATATNFFGTHVGAVTGNVTGTATTATNINTSTATTAGAHYLLFSPVNATASGVAVSSDSVLQFNPGTNVLTTDIFSGNLSATAATATNFFGTLVGNSSTATTASNVNVNTTTINATHYITFSPALSGSGLATSTDTDLSYNPGTNVLTAGVFSGNHTGTAFTATNFFGTLTGNVTGNVTGTATTAQNLNTTAATTAGAHYLLFSPVNGASGVAVSSDTTLQFNPGTNVLTTDVFSGNLSATAATATNFFGTLTGNVTGNVTGNLTGTATTAQNINLAAGANNSNHSVVFSLNATGTGIALSSDAGLQYNPSTNLLTADVFSGNFTGTAATATNFYGTHIGAVTGNVSGNVTGTSTTSQNVNTVTATTAAVHYITFSPVNGASGVALSSDTQLTYNPGTDVLSASVFSGNVTGTAITATNFYGTLVGNTATATTSQNINTTAATTAGTHYLLFSPVNATASGVAVSSDSTLQFNPGTNVLTTDVFSGNFTGTAATATNFFGALTGNVTGTATTSQNVNLAAGANNSSHSIVFSLNATGSGVALSSDAQLTYNPSTDVLSATTFSGNVSGTAITSTNFFGTLTGNVTGNLTGTATTSQNVNLAAGANNSNHSVIFSLNATGTGVGLSSDAGLQYNPSTNVITADVFSGNHTGTAFTATNFFGTLVGNSSTATTAQNVNTVTATTSGVHYITFSPVNGASGVALSSDTQLTYNPATDVLSATTFSGNATGTAITATNFYGTLIGSVGTATTSQNINTTAATTAGAHYLLFSPVNATASGVAVSSDAQLQFNPGTNVLAADVFSGNLSATAATATNFYGTHIGNVTGTATTSQNINTVTATTAAVHYLTFSPANGASGVALSSDTQLTYNPATDVLSSTTFSGNLSGTAVTSTNFFGNLTGTATTSQNINTTAATTAGVHYLLFSPINATASGVAVSSDSTLQFNPGTNVLTTDVFSGNVTGTAVTATNFFGSLTGNITGTATTAQNVNLAAGANNSNHSVVFSLNATGTGVGLSSDAGLQYNPSTNVLTADVFNGNFTGTAATATNFFGTHVGAVTGNVTGTATTSQNVNTVTATTAGVHYLTFSPINGASGVALSSDAQLTYNPATDVLSATTFSGNVTGTAITATNFYGTLIGSVGSATTSQNINTTAATTAGVHYLLFSPVNATASGVAVSSDSTLQFNPGTNVLTTDIFSGNLSATAATATNFFGTLTGNVTGTATTSQNVNLAAGANNSNHSVIFSLNATGTGVGLSSDAGLQYNPSTNVLTADVFTGNLSGTAVTATNFFGTLTGNVTGTATTAQNINLAAGANNSNHSVVFSLNATGTGVGLSSDAGLQYNPSTNVLTADVFTGNLSGTAATAINFYGTHIGAVTGNVTGTATTSQNVNTVTANTSTNHFITFSPVNGASGVALSSDAQLTYNPATDVLSATTFSGNVSGTAITASNFYGTLIGSVGSATTSQNINTTAATTAGAHYLLFSPVNATTSGVAVSSDAQLQFNPGTNVLTADVFSGNLSATAATATNFFGTLTGNVTGTATTSQNINVVSATTSASHPVLFTPATGTASGAATSSNATLSYNPSSFVLSVSGLAITNNTPSFSTTTGALVVTGGVGIGGSIFTSPTSKSSISGVIFNNSRAENGFQINSTGGYTFNITDAANNQRLNYHGDANRTDFTGNNAVHEIRLFHTNGSAYTGLKSNSSGTVTYTFPAGDGSNGQFLRTDGAGALSWATAAGGAGGGSSGVNAGGQYQLAYYASTGGSVDGSATFTNNTSTSTVTISHATSSTATNIGALVVTGGLGLGGNAFIGGTVTITNATASTTTANGALVVTGGLGVGAQINSASIVTTGNAVFNGNLQFKGTGTFGDNAAVDTIAYNARSTTDFNPSTSNSIDLGFNTLVWRNLFANFITGSAITATNFYGTLAGNVTGTSTTSQNINTTAATTAGIHYLLFSPINGASGVAVSSDTTLQFNPGTNVLTTDVFAGNLSATAATATNFFGTLTGNVTGSLTGSATTAQSVNTVTATTSAVHYLAFSPTNGGSGVALSSDTQLTYNPATDVLSATTFSGNVTGTAITATNFYGTLVGSVGSATTSANINTTSATTAGAHYLLFSPVNATASGVAVSSDAQLQFNPGTNVLSADVFSGNLSGTAATATNFFGTLTGNVTGTATTAQNVNTVSANTNSSHFLTFSPVNGGSGVALSTDTNLTFNSLSNVLTSGVFSGNLSATAATSGLFAVGNLTYAATNLLAAFQSSVNGYNQVVIQNSNNGAAASSDLVVNNDISTDTGAFGTFGMNSSGFTGLGSTNIPNAVYVTAATAELVLGTTTNNRIRFVNENVDTFQITATGSSVYTTTATLSKNSGAFVVAGGAAIGLSLSVGQGIQLYNSTNGNHTGFKAGATSANSVYTLPLAYPSTGSSILQSDTAGTMIWVNSPSGGSATPAGNTTELQYNNAGAFGGATGLTWQNSAYTLQVNSNASHTTSAQVGLRLENGLASGGQATRWSPTFEMAGRSGIANVYFSRFATEVVPSGPATYASALRFRYSQDQGTASFGSNLFSIHSTLGIGIGGSTVSSNFMSYIRAHESQAADIFYKLPLTAPGTGASFLQCDTSGNMSWVNSPGGGSGSPAGSSKQIQYNNAGAFGGASGFEYITAGNAVTVSMFSTAGGGFTAGLFVNVLSATSTKIGIGISNPQYELEINGELSATNKSFVINHPTKPGMKLRYGSLEGPENGVYVRGELNGSNIIEVPDHWIGLVHEDSYTVHLTPFGRYSQLYVEKIENYNVYIADNFMNSIHCYYSVWAERKDIPKLVTEY